MTKKYDYNNKKNAIVTSICLLFLFIIIILANNLFSPPIKANAQSFFSSFAGRNELYASKVNLSTLRDSEKEGVDFLVSDSTTSYTFNPNNIVFTNGYIVANIPIKHSAEDAGIFNAMKNPDLLASLKFEAIIETTVSGVGSKINMFIAYSNSGFDNLNDLNFSSLPYDLISSATSGEHAQGDDISEVTLGTTTQVSKFLGSDKGVSAIGFETFSEYDMFSIKEPGNAYAPSVILVIKTTESSANKQITVKNLSLTTNVTFGEKQLSIKSDTMIEIFGENRKPYLINDIEDNSLFNEAFVKSGDKIKIRYSFDLDGNPYSVNDFRNNFGNINKIFNFPNATDDVLWRYFLNKNDLPNETNNILTLVDSQIIGDGSHVEVIFEVRNQSMLGVSDENFEIYLVPRLFKSREDGRLSFFNYFNEGSFEDFLSDNRNVIWKFIVDNDRPNKAVIDPNSELGIAISAGDWYTKNSEVPIQLHSDSYNSRASYADNLRRESYERLYAIILPDDVNTISTSNIDFDLNKYLNYDVHFLGDMHTRLIDINSFYLNFTDGLKNSLALIIVDSVGNMSLTELYCSYRDNPIKVDSFPQNIRLIPYIANEMQGANSPNYMSNFGKATFYIDNETYYENGELKDNLPSRGDGVTPGVAIDNTLVASFKRDKKIIIRFIMEDTHTSKYVLTRYGNANNSPGLTVLSAVGKKLPSSNNGLYFDMIYQIRDIDWETGALDISMHFGEYVNIEHNGSTYNFEVGFSSEGVEHDISDDFNAITKISPIRQITPKPDFYIDYFEVVTYTIEIDMTVPEDGSSQRNALVYLELDMTNPIPIRVSVNANMKNKGYVFTIPFGNGERELTTLDSSPKQSRVTEEGIPLDVYVIDSMVMQEAKADPFIDAGIYAYRVYIKTTENSRYFGENIGMYEIRKTEPIVRNLEQAGYLNFGDSLSSLKLQSRGASNQMIYFDDAYRLGDLYYYPCAIDGLYGTFSVTNPEPNNLNYTLPDSNSSFEITVQYEPIDLSTYVNDAALITQHFAFLSRYFEEIGGTYHIKKGSLHAGNIRNLDMKINIAILHKNVEIVEKESGLYSTIIETEYDGNEKSVIIVARDGTNVLQEYESDMTDLEKKRSVVFLVEYRRINSGGTYGAWSTEAPDMAGEYQVRAKVNSDFCNYQSDTIDLGLIIEKQELKIHMDTDAYIDTTVSIVKKDTPYNITALEQMGIYEITYMYRYIFNPILYSTYLDEEGDTGEENEEVNLYFFSIYSHANKAWLPESNLNNMMNLSHTLEVGSYVLLIEINSVNFRGREYVNFEVFPPDELYITPPSIALIANYAMYSLTGDLIGDENYPIGHMEYGQILKDLNIFDEESVRELSFVLPDNTIIEIEGRFYFESEESYYARNSTLTPKVSPLDGTTLILPVLYSGNTPVMQRVKYFWEAGKYVDGQFEKNNNFALFEQMTEFYVVRAKLDMSNLSIESSTYGEKLNSQAINGYISSHEYLIPEELYKLELKNSFDEDLVFPGGDNLVDYVFSFVGEYASEFDRLYYVKGEAQIPYGDVKIPYRVDPKEVEIIVVKLDKLESGDLEGYNAGIEGLVFKYSEQNDFDDDNIKVKEADDETNTFLDNVLLDKVFYRVKTSEHDVPDSSKGEEFDPAYPSYIKIATISRHTEPGAYKVIIKTSTDEKNYIGQVEVDCFVIRGNLQIEDSSSLYIQYGYKTGEINEIDSLAYLKDYLSNVMLVNENEAFKTSISGSISFVYDDIVFDEITDEFDLEVIFIPKTNSNVYPFFKPFDKVTIRIIKRKVSFEYNTDLFEFDYDGYNKNPIVSILNPIDNNPINAEEIKLIVEMQISRKINNIFEPVENIIDAGEYKVVVRIKDNVPGTNAERLFAEETKFITVKRAEIVFSPDDIEYIYNGYVQDPLPKAFLKNIEQQPTFYKDLVVKTYKNYNGVDVEPVQVGMYTMSIRIINEANYEGSATIKFYISPNIDSFNGLEQVYKNPQDEQSLYDVSINFKRLSVEGIEIAHPYVSYSLLYRYQNTIPWTPLPKYGNAGKYEVQITFNQDGYNKVLTKNLDGSTLEVIVSKAKVDFTLFNIDNQVRDFVYIEQQIIPSFLLGSFTIIDISYKFANRDSSLTLEEQLSEISEEDFNVPAINAGSYIAKVIVNSTNYSDYCYTTIRINKATLSVKTLPSVKDNEFIYFNTDAISASSTINHEETELLWVNRGTGAQSVFTDIGSWTILTDISNFIVGTYRVDMMYQITDPDYKDNFEVTTARLNIRIYKRDISNYIEIDESSLIQSYKALRLQVVAFLNEEANIAENYPNIKLNITYDGANIAPRNVGTYSIKVVIDDYNYSGVLESSEYFEIIHAIPEIKIKPLLKNKSVGDTIDSSDLLPGGLAVISGTDIQVVGAFSLKHIEGQEEGDWELNKANHQKIHVLFSPYDPNSFSSTVFSIEIMVNGLDPELRDITVTAKGVNHYGTPLSGFNIEFNSNVQGMTNGVIEWKYPDAIPNVGGLATYVFTPPAELLETHNIVEGEIAVPLVPSTMMCNAENSYVRIFLEQTIEQALNNKQYSFELREVATNTLIEEYFVEIFKYSENFDQLKTASNNDIGKVFTVIEVKISTANHEPIYQTVEVWTNKNVYQDNISMTKIFKYYDGEPANILDYLIISQTDYAIESSSLHIEKIIKNGKDVTTYNNTSEAGMYQFFIKIDELSFNNGVRSLGNYYGLVQVSFEVRKRDITTEITISTNELTYTQMDVDLEFFVDNSTTLLDKSYLSIAYYRKSSNAFLGSYQPRSIGNYYVTVKVLDLHPNYVSVERSFEYEVVQAPIDITFSRSSFVIDYGQTPAVVPEFSYIMNDKKIVLNLIEGQNYIMNYYEKSTNKKLHTIEGANAGLYRIEVILKEMDNYKGVGHVDLQINKVKTHIETPPNRPTVPIKYGTSLQTLVLTGGRAVEVIEQNQVDGKFEFVMHDNFLDAGEYSQIEVVFKPTSKNYEESSTYIPITIEKINLTVNLVSHSQKYTGKTIALEYTTSLGVSVPSVITINNEAGMRVSSIFNVGSYFITIQINHNNYQGSLEDVFVVTKGDIYETQVPETTRVMYGNKLSESSITNGLYTNKNGETVSGQLKYKMLDKIMDLGIGEYLVSYSFEPNNSNYSTFEGLVYVEIVKMEVTVLVSNVSYEYGVENINPNFHTSIGKAFSYDNMEFENDLLSGKIKNVGNYGPYTVSVQDEFYSGLTTYMISITKKEIKVIYNLVEGINQKEVSAFVSEYGKALNYKISIRPESIAEFDLDLLAQLSSNIKSKFTHLTTGVESEMVPVEIGVYTINPYIINNNYYLSAAEHIKYEIIKATVSISFDQKTLTQKIYGSVVTPPVVITNPASSNAKIKISFPGSTDSETTGLPQTAGTHRIKAEIIDPNYNYVYIDSVFIINRKGLTIENLEAFDKVYDGFSSIKLTGSLKGVLEGDQVVLELTATTFGNKIEPGIHNITLVSYKISGLDEANYYVNKPVVTNLKISIKEKRLVDNLSTSYVRSDSGFDPNMTISVVDVKDTGNKTNVFTSQFLGQEAVVKKVVVEKNGMEILLDEPIKFHVKIPNNLLKYNNLVFEGRGGLAGQNINFTREGDYVTYYARTSGEVLIYSNDFPYWIIIVSTSVLMVIVGVVVTLILSPVRKRKKITADMQKTKQYEKGFEEEAIMSEQKAAKKEINKKRDWRK